MINIKFVDALAASGKTYAAAKKSSIDAAEGHKILFVQPTNKLIAETVDHTFKIQGVDPTIVTEFSARTCPDGGIVASIIDHMSNAMPGRGEIVVITHTAFLMLAERFKGGQRRAWTVLIDEALEVQKCMQLNLTQTHELLTRHLDVVDKSHPVYWRIAKKPCSTHLDQIARNSEKDDVWSIFQTFAAAAISNDWHLLVKAPQYNALVTNTDVEGIKRQINASAFLMPTIVDGWRRVTVMSAFFTETMMYVIWSRLQHRTVNFVDCTDQFDLRFTKHQNGRSLDIYSGLEDHFSKTIRYKKATTILGSEKTVFEGLAEAAVEMINGDSYGFVVNNDIADGGYFSGGVRIPAHAHGLNTFQHLNNIVVLLAANPPPAHIACLKQFADLTDDEIKTALHRLTIYQAAMRISLRDPTNLDPKSLFVPDADTGAWMQQMFPGSRHTKLDVFTKDSKTGLSGRAGRPRIHASIEEKRKAQSENDRHRKAVRDTRQIRWKIVGRRSLNNQEAFRAIELFDQMTEIKNIEVSPLKDPAHFHGTVFEADLQATEGEPLIYSSFNEFADLMRELSGESHASKNSCWLWSPSHFIPDTPNDNPANTRRGYVNIAYCRHIILDNDGGDLTPEQFVAFFPGLRMITYSTWSSNSTCRRWRVLIETDTVVDIEGYKIIVQRLMEIVKNHGYHATSEIESHPELRDGKGFKGAHGFDMGKMHPACLVYVPSLGASPSDAFFHDHNATNRQALPVEQWLADAPVPLLKPVQDPPPPILTAPNPLASTAMQKLQEAILNRRSKSIALRKEEKVQEALASWVSIGDQPGQRDRNFIILAGRLKRAGCCEAEGKDILKQMAARSAGGAALKTKINRVWQRVSR